VRGPATLIDNVAARPAGSNPWSRFGVRAITEEPRASLHGRPQWLPLRLVHAESSDLATPLMPKAAESKRRFAFCCFPHASPAFALRSGKQKTVPRDRSKHFIFLMMLGAGEAIRTPDPNLGKRLWSSYAANTPLCATSGDAIRSCGRQPAQTKAAITQ